jgi:spore maturation protein CgeB
VEQLFLRAAELAPDKTFLLGGEGWADKIVPRNVRLLGHVPTGNHNRVNCSASLVMNINRASMAGSGFSPPTRIFEAAGAGAALICDDWPGIDDAFEPGKELFVVRSAEDVVAVLNEYGPATRKQVGANLLARALRDHTYSRRAEQAERAILALGREFGSATSAHCSAVGGLEEQVL